MAAPYFAAALDYPAELTTKFTEQEGLAAHLAQLAERWAGLETFDAAALETGFLVYDENSPGDLRFNPQIYDRQQVADAGAIIPVNRKFDGVGNPADNLIVIWYERRLGKLLFPWQPVRYQAEWPAAGDVPRIVIASRLGSEGKSADLRDQPTPRRRSCSSC